MCMVRDTGFPTGEMTSREERKYVDKSGVEGTDNLHFYSALARYQTNSLAQEMLANGESYGMAAWRRSGATRCEVRGARYSLGKHGMRKRNVVVS